MKKSITLILIMLLTIAAIGQITLNQSNVPIPTSIFNLDHVTTALPPNPTMGNNQIWNYGTYYQGNAASNNYIAESDTFFSNTSILSQDESMFTNKTRSIVSFFKPGCFWNSKLAN